MCTTTTAGLKDSQVCAKSPEVGVIYPDCVLILALGQVSCGYEFHEVRFFRVMVSRHKPLPSTVKDIIRPMPRNRVGTSFFLRPLQISSILLL